MTASMVVATDEPLRALAELPAPRRVAIVELLAAILTAERRLAAFYDRWAEASELAGLRAELAALAREKRQQVQRLESIVGPVVGREGTGSPPVTARSGAFQVAFEQERDLDMAYREVLTLLGDTGLAGPLAEAAGQDAGHRRRLRDLYVRYS
jgi:rubrerythrin